MKGQVVVAVFVHSDTPSKFELISFEQCFRVLGAHQIKVFAKRGLTLNDYRSVFENFSVVYLDEKWLSSIGNYNKLKLSQFLYRQLADFEYLLTYELDAFVFKDELNYWCNQGYDYIGAPWFEGFTHPINPLRFLGVGNSGFSLRRISTIRKLIIDTGYGNIYNQPGGRRNKLRSILLDPLVKFQAYFGENPVIQRSATIVEDQYLFYSAKRINPDFKFAPVSDAVKFSFEVCPRYLYERNHLHLPFGCHAWWRYDFAFWKPHIEKCGYQLD